MRRWVDRMRARERLERIAHAHGFHAAHGYVHVVYLIAVASEGLSFHSMMGGTMCVFSIIAVLAGD